MLELPFFPLAVKGGDGRRSPADLRIPHGTENEPVRQPSSVKAEKLKTQKDGLGHKHAASDKESLRKSVPIFWCLQVCQLIHTGQMEFREVFNHVYLYASSERASSPQPSAAQWTGPEPCTLTGWAGAPPPQAGDPRIPPQDPTPWQHVLYHCSRPSEPITFPFLLNLLFTLYIVPRAQEIWCFGIAV